MLTRVRIGMDKMRLLPAGSEQQRHSSRSLYASVEYLQIQFAVAVNLVQASKASRYLRLRQSKRHGIRVLAQTAHPNKMYKKPKEVTQQYDK
jgi:hypothetical protein